MQTETSDAEPRRLGRVWWWSLIVVGIALVTLSGWLIYRAWILRSIPLRISSAELSLRSGRSDAARSLVAPILFFEPHQPDAISIFGRCYLNDRQPEAAITVLALVPEESDAYEKAGYALATALLQTGDLERAETELRRLLSRFPKLETARDELRWLYFNQFRTREVEAILEDKLKLNPGDHKTLAELLDCEYRQQVPFEGAGYLEQIDDLKSGQGTVSVALGYAKWRMGQVEKARTLFQKALAARPDEPQVRFTVVEFLIEQGQLDEAEQILKREPVPQEDDRYWSLKSQLAEQRRDDATALTDLDQAIQRHGNNHRYASRRANLLRKLARGAEEVKAATETAHRLQRVDREFADLIEARANHQTTRRDALRFAELYDQLGKTLPAENWRLLAPRLPEGTPSP